VVLLFSQLPIASSFNSASPSTEKKEDKLDIFVTCGHKLDVERRALPLCSSPLLLLHVIIRLARTLLRPKWINPAVLLHQTTHTYASDDRSRRALLLPEKQRGWTKLLSGKHRNLYSPPTIIRVWK
jgi:hypothetical protein